MHGIYLITDYKGRFGTKYTALPYRSGMDKDLLKEEFLHYGINAQFLNSSQVEETVGDIEGKVFLYTSSEDRNGYYKSFLEDVILSIESRKGVVIPRYIYMHAHNNKVFAELLKNEWGAEIGDNLRSKCFGSYEELVRQDVQFSFPVVVKRPEGFKSRGVYLASDMQQLLKIASKISSTPHLKSDLKDYLRRFIHPGFTPDSRNRKKFVIQDFIPGLKNDWKVLVYGDKFYPLLRQNRKNDFRASGSGLLSYPTELPPGLLDFSERVRAWFNVPQISIDIAVSETGFHVMEVQFLYFGTYTIEHAEFYFSRDNGEWKLTGERSVLEKEYVSSIVSYLKKNSLQG